MIPEMPTLPPSEPPANLLSDAELTALEAVLAATLPADGAAHRDVKRAFTELRWSRREISRVREWLRSLIVKLDTLIK
jgi:hypothetical protein